MDSGLVLRMPRNDERRKVITRVTAYALLFFGAPAGGFVSDLAGFGTARNPLHSQDAPAGPSYSSSSRNSESSASGFICFRVFSTSLL
jgi:hypothetical protein